MVEDRVTDGERIGKLLASELTGLDTGPLAAVAVTDAEPGATPSPEGTRAFTVTFAGEAVGRALLYPGAVGLHLDGDRVILEDVRDRATGPDLAVALQGGDVLVRVESGAAVKRAVDALVAGLAGGTDPSG